jgi:hypothetical protein
MARVSTLDQNSDVQLARLKAEDGYRRPPAYVARGLQGSRGDVRQHLLLQR